MGQIGEQGADAGVVAVVVAQGGGDGVQVVVDAVGADVLGEGECVAGGGAGSVDVAGLQRASASSLAKSIRSRG
ncbi:hypothetical protein ABT115_15845 [Streptomyces sp. NPDC001832]|uniref:hypothetical protein n=1 Tax=Streptomyces sp. NPDC001832 TaxID=3154527 RepID=UPI003322286B